MKQSSKTNTVKVTTPTTSSKAGKMDSTVEDTTGWATDGTGNKVDSGRLAISDTALTTITGCETAYPDLWANAPTGWRSGSNLVVPPQLVPSGSEWFDVSAEMDQNSGYPTNTGLSDAQQNFTFYRYRAVSKNSIEVHFRWNSTTSGSGASSVNWQIPDGTELGLTGLTISSAAQNGGGTAQTYKLSHVDPATSLFAVSTCGITTAGIEIYRQGAADSIIGSEITAAAQAYVKCLVVVDEDLHDNTPYIQLFDNAGANVLGIPKTKYQRNLLSGDISSTNTDIASLKFSNLTVGNTYRVFYQGYLDTSGSETGADYVLIDIYHDGVRKGGASSYRNGTQDEQRSATHSTEAIFVATTTTVNFRATIGGSGKMLIANDYSYTIIEELPRHEH
jgi:hypothetical protein